MELLGLDALSSCSATNYLKPNEVATWRAALKRSFPMQAQSLAMARASDCSSEEL